MQRRPLKIRQRKWANTLAQWLIQKQIHPNHISILGILFAVGAGISLLLANPDVNINLNKEYKRIFFLMAAAGIQLRLLCNMLDGMVALGRTQERSKLGELFNELPDRFEDCVILICAGYAVSSAWASVLGWAAALLAVLTAYIRAFGASLGTQQYFCGPMAKPHRMAALTAGCLWEFLSQGTGQGIVLALGLIVAGAVITSGRRILYIVRELQTRSFDSAHGHGRGLHSGFRPAGDPERDNGHARGAL